MHRVALDVHAEDLAGRGLGLVGRVGELDAAGLAAAAGLDLGLDDDQVPPPKLLGRGSGLGAGRGDHAAEHGHAVLLEQVARLVLEQVHPAALRPSCVGPDRAAARIVVSPSRGF